VATLLIFLIVGHLINFAVFILYLFQEVVFELHIDEFLLLSVLQLVQYLLFVELLDFLFLLQILFLLAHIQVVLLE